MIEQGTCLKCGSTQVMNDVSVLGGFDQPLTIQVNRKPKARVFKDTVQIILNAFICCQCGYSELYVSEPDKLAKVQVNALQGGGLSLTEEAKSVEVVSIEDRLGTLDRLLEKGLINEAVHAAKKTAIIDEI